MGIYRFYKQEGELMDEFLARFDKHVPNAKRCYTGRLDPLASGEVIILTDNDIFKKELFCNMVKEYTFTLLHGFKTDTCDIMGLVTEQDTKYNDMLFAQDSVSGQHHATIFPKSVMMEYPIYSNYNIKGKPSWYYAVNNIDRPYIPTKKIDVLDFRQLGTVAISGDNLLRMIKNKISKVTKDSFRQQQILAKWITSIDLNKEYHATKFTITLSSGGFVRYFGDRMNGTCYDIRRTRYLFDM